jgi:tetratricopeptide (TPR) repeat protein/transcriptional regulator with XRE-family HTH domain
VDDMTFGELVRIYRTRLSWTQAELAGRAGVSERTVHGLELNRTRPRPSTARMLAEALGLTGKDHERFLWLASGWTDPATDGPPVSPAVASLAAAVPTPAQLPADIIGFAGRESDLNALDASVPVDGGVKVVVLAGAAGVGKTALAVRWGHRVAAAFPDGQLYSNLRGFAPGQPLEPVAVLAGFLDALGVPDDRIPPEQDTAAALYRSMTAARRMLVVLDNALDVDQVRPLLPGGTGNLVLVTSRDLLTGLVVSHGARQQTLGPLTATDAMDLVTHILGADRVDAEPDATAALVAECARLPLALRIASANIRVDPHIDISEYVTELRASDRLNRLSVGGDSAGSVRAAFDWSYRRLTPSIQRLFRHLGLVPGPDVTPEAAAAITGADSAEAAHWLRALADVHLLDRNAPQRYTFHDLLRAFAAERTHAVDSRTERDAAVARLLDWYLRTTVAAAETIAPTVVRLPAPPAAASGPPSVRHPNPTVAMNWLQSERRNLVAAVTYAADHGPYEPAWRIADALRGYFAAAGHLVDWIAVGNAAYAAATAGGDLAGQAAATAVLAHAYNHAADYDQAIEQATVGLSLSRQAGWLAGEARALNQLGLMHSERGHLDKSVELLSQALALDRRGGDRPGVAVRLLNLGLTCTLAGRLTEAIDYLKRSSQADDYDGHGDVLVWALANLGRVQRLTGDFDAATATLTKSISRARTHGMPQAEGYALGSLSGVHADRGQLAEAELLADAAEALARESDAFLRMAWAINRQATVDVLVGRLESAGDRYEQVIRMTSDESMLDDRIEALVGLAAVERLCGRYKDAVGYAERGCKAAESGGYRIYHGEALAELGRIQLEAYRRDHNPATADTARAYLEQALDLQRRTGHRVGEARTLILLGELAHTTGDPAAADRHWRAALALGAKLGLAEISHLHARHSS